MSALPVLEPMTFEDLLTTPDDGQRYEIVHGEMIATASPTPFNVLIAAEIAHVLEQFVRERKLGTLFPSHVDVRFSEHDILEPDLCFVSNERSGIIGERMLEGAPDIVIEVLSPSTRRFDLVSKRAVYTMGGVREYWIVDPETRSIRVIAIEGGRSLEVVQPADRVRSLLFPDLVLMLDDVFRIRRNSGN